MPDAAPGPATDGCVPTTLADGTAVLLRPAADGDAPRILDGFERCSVETRYFRFLSGGYRLTDARLLALTSADQVDHVVWVALDADAPGTPVIALARFIRLDDRPDTAEVAFIVGDDYQGRGVGHLLFDALRVAAGVHGVTTFVAEVLAENAPMKSLLLRRGARVTGRSGPELTMELSVDGSRIGGDDGLDEALAEVARAAAGR